MRLLALIALCVAVASASAESCSKASPTCPDGHECHSGRCAKVCQSTTDTCAASDEVCAHFDQAASSPYCMPSCKKDADCNAASATCTGQGYDMCEFTCHQFHKVCVHDLCASNEDCDVDGVKCSQHGFCDYSG